VRVPCEQCDGFVPADAPLVENAVDGSHELRCPEDGSVVAHVYRHVAVGDSSVGGYSMRTHVWIRVDGEGIAWRDAARSLPPNELS
jgi:hypothetical protein